MVDFEIAKGRAPDAADSAPFHEWVFPDGTLWTSFFRTESGYLLKFPGVGDFSVDRSGRSVRAWPAEGAMPATLEHIYLNQVLPLAWSKQGRLVLHASAVEVGGRAAVFVGRSGFGKSTLAASFVLSGCRLICDDALLLDPDAAQVQAQPGHPSMRLWPDSERALDVEGFARAPALPFTTKSRFSALDARHFCDEKRSVAAVFFLGTGQAAGVALEPLRATEALVEMVKHSFLLDTEERELLSANFDALSRLAALPIHYRLDYPRNFEVLPQVRRMIVELCEDRQP